MEEQNTRLKDALPRGGQGEVWIAFRAVLLVGVGSASVALALRGVSSSCWKKLLRRYQHTKRSNQTYQRKLEAQDPSYETIHEQKVDAIAKCQQADRALLQHQQRFYSLETKHKQTEHALTQSHARIQQLVKQATAVARERDDAIALLQERTRSFMAEQKRVEQLQREMARASTGPSGNEFIKQVETDLAASLAVVVVSGYLLLLVYLLTNALTKAQNEVYQLQQQLEQQRDMSWEKQRAIQEKDGRIAALEEKLDKCEKTIKVHKARDASSEKEIAQLQQALQQTKNAHAKAVETLRAASELKWTCASCGARRTEPNDPSTLQSLIYVIILQVLIGVPWACAVCCRGQRE